MHIYIYEYNYVHVYMYIYIHICICVQYIYTTTTMTETITIAIALGAQTATERLVRECTATTLKLERPALSRAFWPEEGRGVEAQASNLGALGGTLTRGPCSLCGVLQGLGFRGIRDPF